MQDLLKQNLLAYLTQNNPELLIDLQATLSVSQYLGDKVDSVMVLVMELLGQGKPGYIIEELAMNELTADLRPSRFNYVQEVLELEFPDDYLRYKALGALTYETINLIDVCKDIFPSFSFSEENQDDRLLRYAIIAAIHEYIN